MIEVRQVTKQYGDGRVLSDVSFCFSGVGIHGIFGTSGSGKSILTAMIATCVPPDSGVVLVDGKELDVRAPETRQRVGYLPGDLRLYGDMTAYEILDFVGRTKRIPVEKRYRQIKEALDLTAATELAEKTVASLSVGQRRRVELALTLLGNPDRILLDEPFRGLESTDRREIADIVRMLGRIKPVVLTASSSEDIYSLCTDAVLLSEGKVVCTDTVEALKNRLSHESILRISANGDAGKMKEKILCLTGVLSCQVLRSDENGNCTIGVRYIAGSDTRNAVLAACEEAGGMVRSMEAQTPSLSELCVTSEDMPLSANEKAGEEGAGE